MGEDKRLYPISEKVLPIIEGGCVWEKASAQGVTLPGVLRDTVYSDDRLSVAGFVSGIRVLACDIRPGLNAKFHVAATSEGRLVEGFLTGGQVHDMIAAEDLPEGIVECAMIANREYDGKE
jgi:hypothetical protein